MTSPTDAQRITYHTPIGNVSAIFYTDPPESLTNHDAKENKRIVKVEKVQEGSIPVPVYGRP